MSPHDTNARKRKRPTGRPEPSIPARHIARHEVLRATLAEATAAEKEAAEALARSSKAKAAVGEAIEQSAAAGRRLGLECSEESGRGRLAFKGALTRQMAAYLEDSAWTIMCLPDGIIVRIFSFLSKLPASFQPPSVQFPCQVSLCRFALSCRRFATIFRESYIKEFKVYNGIQHHSGALEYAKLVSGTLKRFASVTSLVVADTDNFSNDRCEEGNYLVAHSDRTFQLAVVARRSIASAVTAGLREGGNIVTVSFESWDTHHHASETLRRVRMDGWEWEPEYENWLGHLPKVETVLFGDTHTFLSAPRLCGDSLCNLKMIDIAVQTFLVDPDCEDWRNADLFVRELARYQNVETLVLRDVERVESLALVGISEVVKALPMLRKFGLLFYHSYFDHLVESPVVLKIMTHGPIPPERRLAITIFVVEFRSEFDEHCQRISSDVAPDVFLSSHDLDAKAFVAFRSAVLGDAALNLDAIHVVGNTIVGNVTHGRDLAVTFHLEE